MVVTHAQESGTRKFLLLIGEQYITTTIKSLVLPN